MAYASGDLHSLILLMVRHMSENERAGTVIRAQSQQEECPDDVTGALELYTSFSREISDSKAWGSFMNAAETVLKRKRGMRDGESLTVESIARESGYYRMGLYRLSDGETKETGFDLIRKICTGFQNEWKRRFYENVLLAYLPNLAVDLPASETEIRLLKYLCGYLTRNLPGDRSKAVWDDVEKSLEGREDLRSVLGQFLDSQPPQPSFKEYTNPYTAIESYRGAAPDEDGGKEKTKRKIPLSAICAELNIDEKTYRNWKKQYKEKAGKGFPKNRMSRLQALTLCWLFRLSVLEASHFLRLNGYSFSYSQSDRAFISCLRGRKYEDAENVLSDLYGHDGRKPYLSSSQRFYQEIDFLLKENDMRESELYTDPDFSPY